MTSIPASRSARAMIFAPRSCPSRPGLATTTRILRLAGSGMDGSELYGRGGFASLAGLEVGRQLGSAHLLARHAAAGEREREADGDDVAGRRSVPASPGRSGARHGHARRRAGRRPGALDGGLVGPVTEAARAPGAGRAV